MPVGHGVTLLTRHGSERAPKRLPGLFIPNVVFVRLARGAQNRPRVQEAVRRPNVPPGHALQLADALRQLSTRWKSEKCSAARDK